MIEKNYLLSVATPFHNTDLTQFKRCMDSMIGQTMGFENIEWVITLHNSEAEYVEQAKEMTAPWPNIKLIELYNDNYTASSPRNECLKHVTGKYVFFLDSDDYLYPDAMKALVDAMEANDGDIGSFRIESITENNALQANDAVRLVYLLDQTKPLIVLHRDSPEMVDYLHPRGLNVTKMFRTSLLREHGIQFSGEIRIGEDVTFNLNCMKYANTVVVLPQLIGYAYLMNAGSLLHSMNTSSAEGMFSFMNDMFHWMEMAAQTGLDTSNIGWMCLGTIAKMLSAPGLPKEIVETWKDKCRPYLDRFPPVKGNAKFMSQEQADGLMNLARSVFSGEASSDHMGQSINTLEGILYRNAGTDMGRGHRFNMIHSYDVFCRNVPLSDYSFYAPLMELNTRIGEKNILCSDPILGYSLTSGTSETARLIPYTHEHLAAYVTAIGDLLLNHDATLMLMASLPKEMEYADHTWLDSISGAVLNVLRSNLGECSYSRRFKRGAVTSPMELLFPTQTVDLRYSRLLFALLEKNTSQIVAPFTWTVLDTMQFLEKNYDSIVRDIEQGTLSSGSDLPDEMKAALLKKLRPDPERAEELKRIFADGFENIIPRLWPDCHRIVAAGAGAFSIYTRKLRYYSGDVTINNGFYAASEAMIGIAVEDGSAEYRFLTDNAFFEFRETDGVSEPVMIEEVQPGKEYELILTNRAGLYRYCIRDVIKVLRKENNVPIFSFEYRIDDSCAPSSVTVTEKTVDTVIPALEEKSGADLRDFCYMENDEGGLTVFVEPASDPESMERISAMLPEERNALADQTLCENSAAYSEARRNGTLPEAKVLVLQPETHLLYRDRRMFRDKTVPDQIKPIRVLDTDEKKMFFLALC